MTWLRKVHKWESNSGSSIPKKGSPPNKLKPHLFFQNDQTLKLNLQWHSSSYSAFFPFSLFSSKTSFLLWYDSTQKKFPRCKWESNSGSSAPEEGSPPNKLKPHLFFPKWSDLETELSTAFLVIVCLFLPPHFFCYGMTRLRKIPTAQVGIRLRIFRSRSKCLHH